MDDDLIRSELDADGVLVATIDMPDRTMNVFSAGLMDALDALMDLAESDAAVQSVVVTSGKASFLAGADLVMVRGYTQSAKTATHDAMFAMCGRLGRQFVRLERSGKPWVAAVNGIALGGGLELALACRVRLVGDDPRIQLGTPEVRWGLLPGAGGTQRLPRLAPCEPALDLLLSGRSIDPATAVRLGIFARALPANALLDEAKAVARSLHGTPYDATAKFANLAQADVPPWSKAEAREAARRHGVGEDDFERYPAYGAIADCVLKGARLPLDEATIVEMQQFLRLMFSPVAGRMVRTLFLERLRAERELAAPPGVAVEGIGKGRISEALGAWAETLARAKLPLADDTSLPADTLELVGRDGSRRRVALGTIEHPSSAASPFPLAVLSPAGPYGRIVESVGADAATHPLVAALAARLRALAWRTPGPASLLQRLHGAALADQAAIAVEAAAAEGAGDPLFLDTAACLAGVTPAWSGGPLTWAWAEREVLRPHLDASAQRLGEARAGAGARLRMIDRSRVGFVTEPTTERIDAWRVELYCRATGETDPVYCDEAAARAAGHARIAARLPA
ncbi:MAG TPA: enoyl-CoA hydratase-related protein [Caldimonas sp.]|nr:enoyl-CoA hydratase-related protein [Caldimonas sp.]